MNANEPLAIGPARSRRINVSFLRLARRETRTVSGCRLSPHGPNSMGSCPTTSLMDHTPSGHQLKLHQACEQHIRVDAREGEKDGARLTWGLRASERRREVGGERGRNQNGSTATYLRVVHVDGRDCDGAVAP